MEAVDLARAAALVAMAIYHFTWDLEFFGWAEPGLTAEGGWKLFARGIASTFLFLVGVSLVLSARSAMNWQAWGIRLAQISGAAAIITVATWFAVPDAFIFFGILHAIALFTVVGTGFVFLPWWVAAITAVGVFWIGQNVTAELFSSPWLWWAGLNPTPRSSNDYVPLFPWLSATLAGIATTKLCLRTSLPAHLRTVALPQIAKRPAMFIARHSLATYLIHQPVLIALIWCLTTVVGPPDQTERFVSECKRSCEVLRDGVFCQRFCGCMTDGMKAKGLFAPYLANSLDTAGTERLMSLRDDCSN
ncbi:conserved hypothetical protein [Ahrensia sp. R2A130]|nr:conserved hypothetical protein [Ahrensia sp. R2A130]